MQEVPYPVEVTYRPPDDAANAEVRHGLLVLDVAGLTDLLTQAMQSGSGQVTLRLSGLRSADPGLGPACAIRSTRIQAGQTPVRRAPTTAYTRP